VSQNHVIHVGRKDGATVSAVDQLRDNIQRLGLSDGVCSKRSETDGPHAFTAERKARRQKADAAGCTNVLSGTAANVKKLSVTFDRVPAIFKPNRTSLASTPMPRSEILY
jgi:hypothetical protein